MRPAKIQTSLLIRTVWSDSSLGGIPTVKHEKLLLFFFLYADNEGATHCADAQADLSIRWAHIRTRFSRYGLNIIDPCCEKRSIDAEAKAQNLQTLAIAACYVRWQYPMIL